MSFERQYDVTEPQAELFRFIVSFTENECYQPSQQDMAEYFRVTRKAIVDRLSQLEAKGLLEKQSVGADRCLRLRHVRYRAVSVPSPARLGAKEAEVLALVIKFIESNGFQPSRDEIAGLLGMSKSWVNQRLNVLETAGAVGRAATRTDRSLRIPGLELQARFSEAP